MRKRAIFTVIVGLAMTAVLGSAQAEDDCTPDPGPQAAQNSQTCFPTSQECATGDYNGVYQVGETGRGSICAGAEGHIIVYTGGNANELCGTIIVADNVVTGDTETDPNTCP
jgi:hypothetical protein